MPCAASWDPTHLPRLGSNTTFQASFPRHPFLLLPNSTIFSLHVYCHLPNSALSVYGLLLRGGGNVHGRAFQSAAKGTFERFLSLLIKASWDAIRPALICMNCALWRYISEIPIAKHWLAGFAKLAERSVFVLSGLVFKMESECLWAEHRKAPLPQMPHRLFPGWCCLSTQGVFEIVSPTQLRKQKLHTFWVMRKPYSKHMEGLRNQGRPRWEYGNHRETMEERQ